MQPQEITDAAERLAFLAFTDPASRPIQKESNGRRKESKLRSFTFRHYDAVGPETMTILQLLEKFAYYRGIKNFRPVHVGYRNFEMLLNVKSLGNLNRQFVSLLRSEQHTIAPTIGNSKIWGEILGEGTRLSTLDEAFSPQCNIQSKSQSMGTVPPRFPISAILKFTYENPRVIYPGSLLLFEILQSYFKNGTRVEVEKKIEPVTP